MKVLKKVVLIVFISLFIPCISTAAMPNIVGAVGTALINLTPTQKAALLEDYCLARGWAETIKDADGNDIPNPVTKTVFMNRDISLNIIKRVIDNYRMNKAFKAVVIEELEVAE